MRADVVLARCQRTRDSYGIRIEEGRDAWLATWSFRVDESQFARSGYGRAAVVKSTLTLADSFRGCPYCEANSFVQCGGCRHLTCHRDGDREWRCGWPPCQVSGSPEGRISEFDSGVQR